MREISAGQWCAVRPVDAVVGALNYAASFNVHKVMKKIINRLVSNHKFYISIRAKILALYEKSIIISHNCKTKIMKIINAPKRLSKRTAIVVLFISAAVIVSGLGYTFWQNRRDSSTADSPAKTVGTQYVPATQKEKQASETHKDKLVENRKKSDQESHSTIVGTKKTVTPVITIAEYRNGSVTVQAYIPGIYEEGGTCTATLKSTDKTITEQSDAFANATTTDCQHINIIRTAFPAAGTWVVTVSYVSATSEGTSTQSSSVEVT